jgi:hypothetical protein
MESLSRLVGESMARHGVVATLDHHRLHWSKWFRCEDSLSVVLAPSKPGIFALGEEVVAPGRTSATKGKRMLALFRISQTEDLGMTLGRLFLPGSPDRSRLAGGLCFARYAVIEDSEQRIEALAALQQWMTASAGTLSAAGADAPTPASTEAVEVPDQNTSPTQLEPPVPLPSGF